MKVRNDVPIQVQEHYRVPKPLRQEFHYFDPLGDALKRIREAKKEPDSENRKAELKRIDLQI